jgi:hypothetical protein
MRGLLTWSTCVVLALAACGGKQKSDRDDPAPAGNGGGVGSDAGSTGGSSGAGGTGNTGGVCLGGSSSSGVPGETGCYADTPQGWQRVPCNCELLLDNESTSALEVRLTLAVTPGDTPPSLTGSPEIAVEFADPDSAFFAVWSPQPENGSAFSITRAGDVTRVRLGVTKVVLAPALLTGCQSRVGNATVDGTFSETLHMEASLTDESGAARATTEGSCFNPLPP